MKQTTLFYQSSPAEVQMPLKWSLWISLIQFRKPMLSFLSLMNVLRKTLLIWIAFPLALWSQENVTTFGVQFKPIIPISTFVDGPITYDETPYSATLTSKTGYSFGMVVRRGISKTISFESGINYVRRNYDLTMSKVDSTLLSDEADFGFVSYNIPVQCLIYIKLGDKLFMNASTGVHLDFYASGTYSIGRDTEITQLSWPHSRIGASYLANLGFEYRTSKNGYFYIGASYSDPFGIMAVSRVNWRNYPDPDFETHLFLGGQFLTLDLRYFFHENPEKRKKKSKAK